MQSYTPLGSTATTTVKQGLQTHEDNINSIRTSNSGTAFPTANLVAGMKCYRTDLKAMYTYNGSSWDKDKPTFDSAPTAGSTNPVTSDGIKKAVDAGGLLVTDSDGDIVLKR